MPAFVVHKLSKRLAVHEQALAQDLSDPRVMGQNHIHTIIARIVITMKGHVAC